MNKEPTASSSNAVGQGKKGPKRNVLDSSRIRFMLALALAVACWMYVTLVVRPGTEQTIDNVPVDFSYGANTYTQLGLSIVNQPEYTVSVVASGDGYRIGSLQPQDFIVYADYSSVKGAGEVSLRLNVKCTASSGGNSISVKLKNDKTTVDVVFDTVGEITLPITVDYKDVTIAEGYIQNKAVALPGEVTLSGPIGELDNVAHVVAEITARGELDGNYTATVPLRYLDAEGNEVKFTYVTADVQQAEVSLTIYKLAQVPISISFINTPIGFDSSVLNYSLSQKSLRVAGPAEIVDTLSEMNVGAIDLSTFALDKVYQLPVTLPTGVVSQENVRTISVSFDTTGLATKIFNLPDTSVEVVNLPAGYRLTVESERIRNVTLCGPQEVLDSLTVQSIVARIDMDDISILNGQQNMAVRIYVPSSGQVFAIGSYTVQCRIDSNA